MMGNFDQAYAVFERSWRYGPDDRLDAEIERISEALCEDDDYIEQFQIDHPGIALDSLEACALYRDDAEKVFKERLNAD